MSTPVNKENSYFNALTGFRFLAACLVFVFHNRKYWRANLNPEVLRFVNEFHIGVTLFFVLSGFLITYTYFDDPLTSKKQFFSYVFIRFARILPLYWLILTLYYLDPSFGNYQFSALTYSLFHGFSGKWNIVGISQAWSLNVEMTFYLLAPFLALLFRKHLGYLVLFLIAIFFMAWGTGFIWFKINGNSQEFMYPVTFLFQSTFFGRSSQFLFGMILAYALKNNSVEIIKNTKYKTLVGFWGIIISAYCIGLFQKDIYSHGNEHVVGELIHLLVLPFFVAVTLAGLIFEKTWIQKFFSSKLIVLLGNASFAFYLIHISYVNLKIKQFVLLPDRNFILLWLISILIYLLFEKPVYKFCRKLVLQK